MRLKLPTRCLVRRGYRRGVGPKFKRAAKTSSIVTSLPREPPVPDTELLEFFSQAQNYLTLAHQHEAVLIVQHDVNKQYSGEQMQYMSNACRHCFQDFRYLFDNMLLRVLLRYSHPLHCLRDTDLKLYPNLPSLKRMKSLPTWIARELFSFSFSTFCFCIGYFYYII
ncbi:hypothetical protein TorRG33x02_342630 [Trema orientale]|uniref:Uncharacterized protein n=1 Tax=Trema orientale TaxID=63057 RepID=A0A2P5ASG5_TREOI|nr:hypothetical protein TorRG33x02_342630 [Trema orientale]